MKNLFAHTDKGNAMCLNMCCISVADLSQIANTISRMLRVLEMDPKCYLDIKHYNKFNMIKNLSINIVGRLSALINILTNSKSTTEIDTSINTLCNLANGLVELRNQIREILDNDLVPKCNIVKESFENMIIYIDYLGLKFCILALAILKTYSSIPSTYSGKIASSLASLLLASLLNIHNNDVKKSLDQCLNDIELK